MRVEHHLLRLARIGAHEHHAAVAEPDVGDLHRRRHAVHDDDLVAPVELVRFARRERQRNVGVRRRTRVLLAPVRRIAANRVVASIVTEAAQLLVNANQRQPLARRFALVVLKQRLQSLSPWPDRGKRLSRPFIMELGRVRADDLPHHLARHTQLATDLLDRLAKRKISPAYLGNRLHNQHSNLGLPVTWRPVWTVSTGVPIVCKSAP